MTTNAFSKEILETELELVRVHRKVSHIKKLEEQDINELLELVASARERCDRFLEKYKGPERKRVANLKSSFDLLYEEVTKPLLENITTPEDARPQLRVVQKADAHNEVPNLTPDSKTLNESTNKSTKDSVFKPETVSQLQYTIKAIQASTNTTNDIKEIGASTGAATPSTLSDKKEYFPENSATTGNSKEIMIALKDLSEKATQNIVEAKVDKKSEEPEASDQPPESPVAPELTRKKRTFGYYIKKFAIIEFILSGILWLAVFLFFAALFPTEIVGIINLISA